MKQGANTPLIATVIVVLLLAIGFFWWKSSHATPDVPGTDAEHGAAVANAYKNHTIGKAPIPGQ